MAESGGALRNIFARLGFEMDPNALRQFEAAVGSAKKDLKETQAVASGIGMELRGAATALWGMAKEGANIQQIKDAFEFMGGTEESLQKARDLMGDLVPDRTLMKASNLGKLFKLPEEQIPNLMKLAQGAAVALGESIDYMLDSTYRAAARGSKLIADNMGIMMDEQTKIYEEWAKANGKNAKTMTDAEKNLAFVTQMVAKADRQMAMAGMAQANSFALLDSMIQNVKDTLSIMLNQALSPVVRELARGMMPALKGVRRRWEDIWGKRGGANAAWRVSRILVEYFKEMAFALSLVVAAKMYMGLIALVRGFWGLVAALRAAVLAAMTLNGALAMIPAALAFIAVVVEDIFVWLRGGRSLIGRFIAKFEEAPGPLGKIARFLRDSKPQIKAFMYGMEEGLKTAWAWVANKLWPVIKKVSAFAYEWVSKIIGFLQDDGPSAITKVTDALSWVWDWIKVIGIAIKDAALVAWDWIVRASLAVWDVMKAVGAAVWGVMTDIGDAFAPLVDGLGSLIKTTAVAAWDVISWIFGAVKEAFTAAWPLISEIGATLYAVAGEVLNYIWQKIQAIYEVVLTVVKGWGLLIALLAEGVQKAVDFAGPYIASFFNTLKEWTVTVIGWFTSAGVAIMEWITPWITGLIGVIAGLWDGLANGVRAARTGWEDFWTWIKSAAQSVADAFSSIFGKMGDIISGVFSEIKSFIQPVIDLIDSTLGKAHKAAVMLGLADEVVDPAAIANAQRLVDLGGGGFGGFQKGIEAEVRAKAAGTNNTIGQVNVAIGGSTGMGPSEVSTAVGKGVKQGLDNTVARDIAVGG